MKTINEQDVGAVGDDIYAKELLNVQTWYNNELKRLNDSLAKKRNDAFVRYQKRAATQAALAATQKQAAKVAGTQQPATPVKTTGTVDSAGKPVNADGSPVTSESLNILKVKEINEETFDTRYADSENVQDLKNYMDAEDIPYIEDEDETTIDFDKNELDPEWLDQLEEIGLEETDDDVETDDILDIQDEEDTLEEKPEGEDITDTHEEIDEEKVFYVKITDADGDFTGKLYKLFDEGDWRAKVVEGTSKTFEKLNYDPFFDEFDIIAFLRENYDDAELITKEQFNKESNDEKSKDIEEALDGNGNMLTIQESHKIQTFEEYLNETR